MIGFTFLFLGLCSFTYIALNDDSSLGPVAFSDERGDEIPVSIYLIYDYPREASLNSAWSPYNNAIQAKHAAFTDTSKAVVAIG